MPAFGLHLPLHLAQAAAVRRYVPAAATSLLALPAVGWLLVRAVDSRLAASRELAWCALAGVAAAACNLMLIHFLEGRFPYRRG